MDGRAGVLHYGATAEDRITVITVSGSPRQQLSEEGGIAPTTAADAMHVAVNAAVDIALRTAKDEIAMNREHAKTILSAPDEQLDWQPRALQVAGRPRPGFCAVLPGAVALYAEAEYDGVFIGIAAASSVPVEELALNLASI
jgi:hypothetical protein